MENINFICIMSIKDECLRVIWTQNKKAFGDSITNISSLTQYCGRKNLAVKCRLQFHPERWRICRKVFLTWFIPVGVYRICNRPRPDIWYPSGSGYLLIGNLIVCTYVFELKRKKNTFSCISVYLRWRKSSKMLSLFRSEANCCWK